MEPAPGRPWWYLTTTRRQSLFLSALAAAAAMLGWLPVLRGEGSTSRFVFAGVWTVLSLCYLASALARPRD